MMMMKKQTLQTITVLLVCMLLFVGCGKSDNRYINCDPQYNNSSAPSYPKVAKISTWTMEDYLAAKEESGFVAWKDWLPWEQFSALGEFDHTFWWDGSPGSSQYEYRYTNPKTGETREYYVGFEKIPEDSGVTNIKEYYQWWYGREYDKKYSARFLTRSDISNSDLTTIELEDQTYYEDELLFLNENKTAVEFVYNGWKIFIVSVNPDHNVFTNNDVPMYLGFGTADCDIIRRLLNADTYKEATQELMNPENAK